MLCAFGVDVLDQRVTPRRVWVLGNRLPPWARAGGEEWSGESYLLALVADHLANLTYVTLRAAGDKSASRPRPLPRPNPAAVRASQPLSEPQRRQSSGWAAVAEQLAGIPGVVTRDG
jgi:hypothetical protein